MDVNRLTIQTARQTLMNQEINPSGLTQAFLAVIEEKNPSLNAFAEINQETAIPSFTKELPLSGIPIPVKDLIDVAGLHTQAGSPKFFGQQPAIKDAAIIEKLKAAGASILGKTNTHEIALGITGINLHTGAVKNPHDPSRITGGSSSGSAAAVASGMSVAAIGSDTGGSIRIPASLCGVVGLKPTYGRVSTRGVLPLSWNLDTIGPITKTVKDAALLLNVLAGYDPRDPTSQNHPTEDYLMNIDDGVKGWKIALATGSDIEECDPSVLNTLQQASSQFSEQGAAVHPVEIARLAECAAANGIMVVADAAALHRERLEQHPDWFGEDVRARLERGRSISATEYALARRTQQEMKRYFDLFFEEYDFLLLPTTATSAAKIEGLDSAAYAPKMTRFTGPFNLVGLPAISIPFGKTDSGLPLAVQLVGAPWAESKILQAGQVLENLYPY